MANGPVVQLADVIVPEIFNPYIQQITEEKSRIIQSGAIARDGMIDSFLAGGGETFNIPSFKDLDDDEDNVSTDTAPDEYTGGSGNSTPKKIGTAREIGVRLSRNQSWGSMDLAGDLIGADPMSSIGNRVGAYWARRLQKAFVATVNGIFAQNDAATGDEKGDMTHDVSGTDFDAATTTFSADAFVDAAVTMGDSMEDLTMIMVHSIVYARMQKNNLIQFIPDARGEVNIPTFLGRTVVVDDGVTAANGVFHTWLFGAGAFRLGMGAPKTPTETKRDPDAGNGSGAEILYNRVEWCVHPVGYAFVGNPAGVGGPSNAATTGNLAAADSWARAYSERKQIKIARLITREFAATP